MEQNLQKAIYKSFAYVLTLSLFYIFVIWNSNNFFEIISSTIYSIILYSLLFSIGKPEVSSWLGKLINNNVYKVGILPVALLILYYSYLAINSQNPIEGINMLLPFLILLPSFVFISKNVKTEKLDWLDFTLFTLFIIPITLIQLPTNSNLPINGNGFDSFYRIMILITIIYSFVVIRKISDVGFYPVFKHNYLWTAIWVWIVFYSLIFVFAWSVDFIKIHGHDNYSSELIFKILRKLVSTFLHVALFEELIFRGLLLNMLQKRIAQSGNWQKFIQIGGISLVLLSLIIGYSMSGSMKWFPAFITITLIFAALIIEKSKFDKVGTYTALALSSIIFGLVHYHAGSIIFVGLASIGGWAYGYTYIKTKNVFYAAIVHTLVNSSALIFGFELAK